MLVLWGRIVGGRMSGLLSCAGWVGIGGRRRGRRHRRSGDWLCGGVVVGGLPSGTAIRVDGFGVSIVNMARSRRQAATGRTRGWWTRRASGDGSSNNSRRRRRWRCLLYRLNRCWWCLHGRCRIRILCRLLLWVCHGTRGRLLRLLNGLGLVGIGRVVHSVGHVVWHSLGIRQACGGGRIHVVGDRHRHLWIVGRRGGRRRGLDVGLPTKARRTQIGCLLVGCWLPLGHRLGWCLDWPRLRLRLWLRLCLWLFFRRRSFFDFIVPIHVGWLGFGFSFPLGWIVTRNARFRTLGTIRLCFGTLQQW